MKKLYFVFALVAVALGTSAFTYQNVLHAPTADVTVQAINFKIFNDSGAELELFLKRGEMEKHTTIKTNQALSLSHVPGTMIYVGKDATGTLLMEVEQEMAGKGFMASKLLAAQDDTER